jgi:hypothetical protein
MLNICYYFTLNGRLNPKVITDADIFVKYELQSTSSTAQKTPAHVNGCVPAQVCQQTGPTIKTSKKLNSILNNNSNYNLLHCIHHYILDNINLHFVLQSLDNSLEHLNLFHSFIII